MFFRSLSFRFFLIFLFLSSVLCEAQSVESRVDNHSLDQKEEFIVPEIAKKNFLRSLQQTNGCNLPCNTDNYCVGWKGQCAHCVNNQCLSTTTPVCGTTCTTNSHCYGGVNGCSSCVGNVCKAQSQALQCGAYCTTDAMCSGATGCNFCVNNKCATSRNPSTGCGIKCSGDFQCSGGVCSRCLNGSCAQPQCGTYCYDNTGCSSGSNGCTSCLSNGNGNSVCSVPSQCGSSCTDNYQCYGNNNGCTTCSSLGQCVQSSIDTACVSTFDDLRSAASGTSDTITLCAGSQTTLYEQLTVNRSGSFTLQCVTGGSCTINGNGSYTNIVINAANAVISGITFQNCKSSDNGGAITINAASQQGSRIQSCTFNSNSAVTNGGAVYVNGYAEIINCFGASNWANQCKTIFENSSGTCTALAVSS